MTGPASKRKEIYVYTEYEIIPVKFTRWFSRQRDIKFCLAQSFDVD